MIDATGGKVVGAVKHPINTPDFSSFLLQAQSSKGRGDRACAMPAVISSTRSSRRASSGSLASRSFVGLIVFIADIHSLGLQSAQGLMLQFGILLGPQRGDPRVVEAVHRKDAEGPDHDPCGHLWRGECTISRAVEAAGTLDGPTVAAKMREMPVNDFMTKNGRIRAGWSACPRYVSVPSEVTGRSPNTSSTTISCSRPSREEAFKPMEEEDVRS